MANRRDIGQIAWFATTIPPEGWLRMGTSNVSGEKFPELWYAVYDEWKTSRAINLPSWDNALSVGGSDDALLDPAQLGKLNEAATPFNSIQLTENAVSGPDVRVYGLNAYIYTHRNTETGEWLG